jgi:hypothetical protein
MTGPLEAPPGTTVVMLVSLQLVAVAGRTLNRTVLLPCVTPKRTPEIVTD